MAMNIPVRLIGWGAFVLVAAIPAYIWISAYVWPLTPAEVLNKNGYLEIRPAENLSGPGTIDTVESRTEKYVMLHPTCDMDMHEVSALSRESPTETMIIAKALNGTFKLGSNILNRAKLNIDTRLVDEIDISIENAKVITISDQSRYHLEDEYLQGDCSRAIFRTSSVQRKCVIQPISAIQADLKYHVKFSSRVSASDKEKTVRNVSAHVVGEGGENSDDSIVSKGLVIGLKLDTFCIVPNNGQPGARVETLPVRNDTSRG
jgi:hypothetical protein